MNLNIDLFAYGSMVAMFCIVLQISGILTTREKLLLGITMTVVGAIGAVVAGFLFSHSGMFDTILTHATLKPWEYRSFQMLVDIKNLDKNASAWLFVVSLYLTVGGVFFMRRNREGIGIIFAGLSVLTILALGMSLA